MRLLLCILFAVSAIAFVGGCKSMTPGHLERVQPYSNEPLVGNVYLLRGFIGIWSYGIDHLGERVTEAGIRSSVYQEDQWSQLADAIIARYQNTPDHEPLVLIGHSYGADDTLRIAKRLQEHRMRVDLIITLDPVTPPRVPGNVRFCYNIYQSSLLDSLPFFRGVPLETELADGSNLKNVNIRKDRRDLLNSDTDHFNIEKNEKIHVEVVKVLKEVCLPRPAWLALRQSGRFTSAITPAQSPAQGGPGQASRAGTVQPAGERMP